MEEYYIIIDSINKDNTINYRIIRFDFEKCLKPVSVQVEVGRSIGTLIEAVEFFISTRGLNKITVLGNDLYINNPFDRDINDYARLIFEHSVKGGYRIKFVDKTINNVGGTIELMCISENNILRYMGRLKCCL